MNRLLMAVEREMYGVVEALLLRGASVFARDGRGRDVFELAQARSRPELIDLLRQPLSS